MLALIPVGRESAPLGIDVFSTAIKGDTSDAAGTGLGYHAVMKETRSRGSTSERKHCWLAHIGLALAFQWLSTVRIGSSSPNAGKVRTEDQRPSATSTPTKVPTGVLPILCLQH